MKLSHGCRFRLRIERKVIDVRLINADLLYTQLQKDEELARKRVLDTESFTPYPNNLNPSYTRYVAQMDERTRLKHMVADAPTIEQRKTGKWIEDAETYYKAVNEKGGGVNENTPYFTDDIACSECLAMFSVIDNETERWNFCPNCGAEMKGDKDENKNS